MQGVGFRYAVERLARRFPVTGFVKNLSDRRVELVAEGKEKRVFDGVEYILERPLPGDYALVKAWKGDKMGNLIFRKTARNFNPMMATAGKITIAEVEELVEVGSLDPDQVHVPGIYVKRIFQGTKYEKRVEKRTVRQG